MRTTPRVASSSWWSKPPLRRSALVLLALVPLLTPVLSPHDDGLFAYPYCAAMQLLAAWCCWGASQRYPAEKVRWQTVMLALSIHAVAYTVTTVRHVNWIAFSQGARISNACISACWVLFLPALVGVRAVRGGRVRALDYLLAGMTCVLMMQAMGSGTSLAGGNSRVNVVGAAILFLAGAAWVTRSASTQPGIKLFASVMALYLSCCVVTYLLLDYVFLIWLPHIADVWSDLLIAVPELIFCEAIMSWQRKPSAEDSSAHLALVDSLQPSIMALGGVLLALYGLRAHSVLAACAVVVLVLLYALRTHFFYQRLFVQQNNLRTRASLLEDLATRDALTGVGNRRWFDEEAQKLLGAERSFPCSMVIVDTDHFKLINDSFGHPIGDEVLRAVAAVLSEVTAQVKRGSCARIGGDEFGAIWPGTSTEQALKLCEAVRARVELEEFQAPVRATVSIGVATAGETLPLVRLMRWADGALYQAKDAGRNLVRGIDLRALRDESPESGGE